MNFIPSFNKSKRVTDPPVVVFAHIPKTAGQTVTKALRNAFPRSAFSPVRTHAAAAADAQMPPGYQLYAGHIDWVDLETLPENRFAFTVLRDPRDRIASFYFYVRREAKKLSRTELASKARTNMRMASTRAADDYFFGGDPAWQRFIQDHYNNFYCNYFITRKIRGWQEVATLGHRSLVNRAIIGAGHLQKVYAITDLNLLEQDLRDVLGIRPHIQGVRLNAGPSPRTAGRWTDLVARFERDESERRLAQFADADARLVDRLGLSI